MGNPPRNSKRVRASIPRAPDGSAFQNCHKCGVSVAITLADMHECEPKSDVKRFKGQCGKQYVEKQCFENQPRSGFRFFMEDFVKTCECGNWVDVDRKGFETWKNMSKKEKTLYALKAEKVNSAYAEDLLRQFKDKSAADDEADSAMVGKYDQSYEYYEDSESEFSDGFDTFNSKRIENFNTYEWEMVRSWFD